MDYEQIYLKELVNVFLDRIDVMHYKNLVLEKANMQHELSMARNKILSQEDELSQLRSLAADKILAE